ncbi:MAG TPA: hypothetical protein DCE42_21710 [Myxococcales bacterium]|nr:hypothetical protein [Myxococcales bacterium]
MGLTEHSGLRSDTSSRRYVGQKHVTESHLQRSTSTHKRSNFTQQQTTPLLHSVKTSVPFSHLSQASTASRSNKTKSLLRKRISHETPCLQSKSKHVEYLPSLDWGMNRKYTIILFIILSSVGLDQWSKQMAVHYLKRPDQGCDRCYKVYSECTKRCSAQQNKRNHSLVACRKNCDQIRQHCRKYDEKNYALCKDYYNKHIVPAWRKRVDNVKGSLNCQRVIMGTHAECVVVEGFFHYKYQINPGAAFGLLSQYPSSFRRPFFITITIIAILFILYVLIWRIDASFKLMIFSLSLILSGALGNFIDRLRLDYVIDFIKWYVNIKPFSLQLFQWSWHIKGGYHEWPTFNVADIAITVGVFLIAIELLLTTDDLDEVEETEKAEDTENAEDTTDTEATENAQETTNTTNSETTNTSTEVTEQEDTPTTQEAGAIEQKNVATSTLELTEETDSPHEQAHSVTNENTDSLVQTAPEQVAPETIPAQAPDTQEQETERNGQEEDHSLEKK